MAILDNSGDIILDAVLTDAGRKKMAAGNFSISKFAFGDDEINYGLYDKNHASGSAYFDLEILQTPVLQAFTAKNANVNYGLTTYTNQRLLYLPVMERNEKSSLTDLGVSAIRRGQLTYIAVNDGATKPALVSAFGAGGDKYVMLSGAKNGRGILMESGLNTTELAGTVANKQNYLVSQNLMESGYTINYDNRFITAMMAPGAGAFLNNNGTLGVAQAAVSFRVAITVSSNGNSPWSNRARASVPSLTNNIVHRPNDTTVDTATSVILGPRSTWTCFSLVIKDLTTEDYNRFGKINQNLLSDGNTYNYIDTEIEIYGATTGAGDIVAVRLIKKV
tara:strand:- start:5593 stop:6594 length:1002 start_codon:yes stop_codon:yes gene_type:complete